MREIIIKIIKKSLENRREYFTREQEIQIYLASELEKTNLFDYVYLEYHIPSISVNNYPWTDSNNIYIDIVLLKDDKYYPIEIKFKTQSQQIISNVFGSNLHIFLGQHGAQNIGCYDFWKDVKRLELFEIQFDNVMQGIIFFVSNDESYLQPPKSEKVGYSMFSIHEGREVLAGETLSWNKNLSVSIDRPPILLNRQYVIRWEALNINQHRYIIV